MSYFFMIFVKIRTFIKNNHNYGFSIRLGHTRALYVHLPIPYINRIHLQRSEKIRRGIIPVYSAFNNGQVKTISLSILWSSHNNLHRHIFLYSIRVNYKFNICVVCTCAYVPRVYRYTILSISTYIGEHRKKNISILTLQV